MINNNQHLDNAGAMTLDKPQYEDTDDVVLHLIPQGTRHHAVYALCGELIDNPVSSSELPKGSATTVCPMCEMEAQAECEGWPNSPIPVRLLGIREALRAMLLSEGLTITDAAEQLGMKADDLHHKLSSVDLSIDETAAICDLCHMSYNDAMRCTEFAVHVIEKRRANAGKREEK